MLLILLLTCFLILETLQHGSEYPGDGRCWGYEDDCGGDRRVGHPVCEEGVQAWRGDSDPVDTFHRQADFGFLREKRESMSRLCRATSRSGSELRCSENLEFCTARNILLDFRGLEQRVSQENLKYKMDIFKPGQIQLSRCDLDHEKLRSNLDYMNPLQSWAPELQHVSVDNTKTRCDLSIDQPTVVMKLDASVNMYHHFCDFFNLYLSLHLNNSLSNNNNHAVWNRDNQVIILENLPTTVKSPFSVSWSAFTSNSLLNLDDLAGKVVCIKNAVFPMLARMVFGLFYNTPVIEGCGQSELFRRFSQFMMERLNIRQAGVLKDRRLRVTLISRDTRYRRIINQDDLVTALEETGVFQVTVARFSPQLSFTDQLQMTHNTDILAGLHGAGLTHLLFLPDWAEVLEIFNCDDANCYKDLSRLRGVGYTTHDWSQESMMKTHFVPGGYQGPAHKKFSNYEFQPAEFVRIMMKIRDKVLSKETYRRNLDKVLHEEL